MVKKDEKKKEKTEFEKLSEKLFSKKKSGWDGISDKEHKEIFSLSEDYKKFLDSSKTEREAIYSIEDLSAKEGYKPIAKATKKDKKLFMNYDGVSGALAFINDKESLDKGFLIVGAHIDAPRLDLKGVPLFEAENMGYMKTHYYGGIKNISGLQELLHSMELLFLKTVKNSM